MKNGLENPALVEWSEVKWIEESCTSGVAWRGVERRGVENPALGEWSEEWIGESCISGVE